MAENGTASVLRRKVDQGRAGAAELKGVAEPGKALADAFRRAAEEELELAVIVSQPKETRATPAELLESLPEQSFLGVLIGPEDGAGLFCLDPGALSAIIEMRTMGRVSSNPPQPRRPTRTDAAMVADVIDRVLAEFEAPLLELDAARWASGWRYQLYLPDPRPLSVVLEEAQHRVLEVEILFGAAAKPGRAFIVLPSTGRARPRPPTPPPDDSVEAAEAAAWQDAMSEAVGTAEASLDAVLGRVRLPLADLSGLAPGDRIALPLTALGGVRLVAPGGQVMAEGRLGQAGGARAVRLVEPGEDSPPHAPDGTIIPAGTLQSRPAPPAPPPMDMSDFQPAAPSMPPMAPDEPDLGSVPFDTQSPLDPGDFPSINALDDMPALD